jgi:hypothetical protein
MHGRQRLLELQPAIGAGALLQRQRTAARRTRIAIEVHFRRSFSIEHGAPVAAQNLGDSPQLILLDQEVRLGPSTFAGAGRTPNKDRDAGVQTTIAQPLHVGDRSGHDRNQRDTR